SNVVSGYTRSTLSMRAALLVPNTFRPGQRTSNSATSFAQDAIRCSQLSSASRCLPSLKRSTRASSGGRDGCCGTPATLPILTGTKSSLSAFSERSDRSTNQTPSGNSNLVAWATSITKRLLPHPPAPVIITSRTPPSIAVSCWISSDLPTVAFGGLGMLFGGSLSSCV